MPNSTHRRGWPPVSRLEELFTYDWRTGALYRSGRLVGNDNGDGHLRVRVDGAKIYVHNIAWALMTGDYPEHSIDHINRDGHDNRFCNLREANQSQQQVNRRHYNSTGYIGVYRHGLMFKAVVTDDGRRRSLGLFNDPRRAAKAVQEWRIYKYGQFAEDRTKAA